MIIIFSSFCIGILEGTVEDLDVYTFDFVDLVCDERGCQFLLQESNTTSLDADKNKLATSEERIYERLGARIELHLDYMVCHTDPGRIPYPLWVRR